MHGFGYFYIKSRALMINYTPQNQLSLSLFKHPFESELDKENRWVKLAQLIPWDELANVYAQHLQSDTGRLSVDVRTVIAALIVKHMLKLDDRGTVQMIQENIYLQFFCGLKGFTTKPVFDPSLFVDIRKRLGFEEFDAFNRLIIEKSEQLKPHQARIKRKNKGNDDPDQSTNSGNRGTLKVDATVADQEIKFPTDVGLLNESREKLEMIIDQLFIKSIDKKKPRTYRKNAREAVSHYNTKRIHNELPMKMTPEKFEEIIVNLDSQRKPTVIIYAEGNDKIRAASNRLDFKPKGKPLAHNCPIETSMIK